MTTKSAYRISDEEFIKIATGSTNIRQALLKMGLHGRGGNYECFKERCKKLNLPVSFERTRNQSKKRKLIQDSDIVKYSKGVKSKAALLSNLGLNRGGGNVRWLNSKIEELNIDTSHFTGQLWSKGEKLGPKNPIENYLIKKRTSSVRLKQRLIEEGVFEYKCSSCNLDTWLENPIPLELDHIDGNNFNNELENLRLLCPNCHALTPTYRGKNMK